MIEYLIDNKEWIFSGIGVFVITMLASFILQKKNSVNKVKIKGSNNKVHQIGTKKENTIEIEGDKNDIKQP